MFLSCLICLCPSFRDFACIILVVRVEHHAQNNLCPYGYHYLWPSAVSQNSQRKFMI